MKRVENIVANGHIVHYEQCLHFSELFSNVVCCRETSESICMQERFKHLLDMILLVISFEIHWGKNLKKFKNLKFNFDKELKTVKLFILSHIQTHLNSLQTTFENIVAICLNVFNSIISNISYNIIIDFPYFCLEVFKVVCCKFTLKTSRKKYETRGPWWTSVMLTEYHGSVW